MTPSCSPMKKYEFILRLQSSKKHPRKPCHLQRIILSESGTSIFAWMPIHSLDHLEEVVTEVEDRFLGIETSREVSSDGTMHFVFSHIARILAETSAKLEPLEDSWDEAARRNGGQLSVWLQSDCDRQMRTLAKRLRFLQIALNGIVPGEATAQNNGTRSRAKDIEDRLQAIHTLLELQLAVASMERKSTSCRFPTPEAAHHNCRRQQLINAGEERNQIKYVLEETAKNLGVLEMCWGEAVDKNGAELRLWLQADCDKELQALGEKLNSLYLAALQEDQAFQVEERPVHTEPSQKIMELTKEPRKGQPAQVEEMSPEESEFVEAEPRQRNIELMKERLVKNASGGPSTNGRQGQIKISAEHSKSLDLRIFAFTDLQRLKRFIISIEARAQNDSRRGRNSQEKIKKHIYALQKSDEERGRINKMVSESNESLGKPEQWREEAERRLGARISTWTAKEFEAERKATYEKVHYLREVLMGRRSPIKSPDAPKRIAFHPLETYPEVPPKRGRHGMLSSEMDVDSVFGPSHDSFQAARRGAALSKPTS
ncbi:hypothetical protein L596_013937 [Steinernema carpocapsae]|uniref:Uncharacterized protein n=1 Tax=Steinernema carpocapsae TaxID=34508 RepID=A0A4U5P1P2_STECR|nr:hypothetical protein L596_013937 [Steinernema carpocapsae]